MVDWRDSPQKKTWAQKACNEKFFREISLEGKYDLSTQINCSQQKITKQCISL